MEGRWWVTQESIIRKRVKNKTTSPMDATRDAERIHAGRAGEKERRRMMDALDLPTMESIPSMLVSTTAAGSRKGRREVEWKKRVYRAPLVAATTIC